MLAPIAQDQAYHRFADERVLFGLATADVLSSLAFVAVGVMGWRVLWRRRAGFEVPGEWRAYGALFCAVALAGLGSTYYHLAPDDARLAWDRLPIALAFMALLSTVIAERVGVKLGARLLVPLLLLGAGSVLYWVASGDLRLYGLVQFGAIATLLALSALYPARYTRGAGIFAAAALYGVAKFFELQDRMVFDFTGGLLSGHTLKHLIAAGALHVIVWTLQRRTPSYSQATSGACR